MLCIKISEAFLVLINGILLAKWPGPKEFGFYSILIAFVNLAATILTLGFPMLVVRETANCIVLKKWGLLQGLISTTHKFLFLSFTVIFSVTLLCVYLFSIDFGVSIYSLIATLLLALITACNLLRSSFLRGLNRVIISDIPDFIIKPFFFMLLILIDFISFSRFDAQRVFNLQIVASMSALLLGLYFLRSRLPRKIFNASSKNFNRKWLFQALPFLAIAVVGLLDNQVSLYQIGYLSGSEQAGLYQAANQFVGLIILGLFAVNIPLQPEFASAWTAHNREKAQELVTNAARISTILAFIGSLVLLAFAENLLGLLSERYTESAFALRILVLGQMCNAMAGPCGIVLAMSGHQIIVMVTVLSALIFKLILGLILIPFYGIIGAAIASSIGVLSWNLILVYFVHGKLKISTNVFKI